MLNALPKPLTSATTSTMDALATTPNRSTLVVDTGFAALLQRQADVRLSDARLSDARLSDQRAAEQRTTAQQDRPVQNNTATAPHAPARADNRSAPRANPPQASATAAQDGAHADALADTADSAADHATAADPAQARQAASLALNNSLARQRQTGPANTGGPTPQANAPVAEAAVTTGQQLASAGKAAKRSGNANANASANLGLTGTGSSADPGTRTADTAATAPTDNVLLPTNASADFANPATNPASDPANNPATDPANALAAALAANAAAGVSSGSPPAPSTQSTDGLPTTDGAASTGTIRRSAAARLVVNATADPAAAAAGQRSTSTAAESASATAALAAANAGTARQTRPTAGLAGPQTAAANVLAGLQNTPPGNSPTRGTAADPAGPPATTDAAQTGSAAAPARPNSGQALSTNLAETAAQAPDTNSAGLPADAARVDGVSIRRAAPGSGLPGQPTQNTGASTPAAGRAGRSADDPAGTGKPAPADTALTQPADALQVPAGGVDGGGPGGAAADAAAGAPGAATQGSAQALAQAATLAAVQSTTQASAGNARAATSRSPTGGDAAAQAAARVAGPGGLSATGAAVAASGNTGQTRRAAEGRPAGTAPDTQPGCGRPSGSSDAGALGGMAADGTPAATAASTNTSKNTPITASTTASTTHAAAAALADLQRAATRAQDEANSSPRGADAMRLADANTTISPAGPAQAAAAVPGAATGLATATTSSTLAQATTSMTEARIAVPLDSPAFAPALGAQLSLFARDGVQSARLQLNPAEMGPITVQIALDGSAARVEFQADRATTREAIEASLPALAGALQDAGLTLTGGGVFQQHPGRQQQPEPGPATPAWAGNARSAGADPLAATARSGLRSAARGLVDLVA